MRQIRKLPEPKSLGQYRAACGPLTAQTYDGYRDKQTLREQLVREQRGLCCYCLCRIREGGPGVVPPMKIAHWHSRNVHPGEQLDYSNLLGACMGNKGSSPDQQHCDTRQGDRDIKWNPANPDHRIEERIRYLTDGTIASDDLEFNNQIDSVLNLNKGFPRSNRISILDSFQKSLGSARLPRTELERKLREWNGESHDGELNEYCQVVVFWLRRRLNRA